MNEPAMNEPEINPEIIEKTECYDQDSLDSFDDSDLNDSVFDYNNKLILLDISPPHSLSTTVNNMVLHYLDLMECAMKTGTHPTLLAEKLSDFYSELPFNTLNTSVLEKLKNFSMLDETKTVTLYKTILKLLDVIESK